MYANHIPELLYKRTTPQAMIKCPSGRSTFDTQIWQIWVHLCLTSGVINSLCRILNCLSQVELVARTEMGLLHISFQVSVSITLGPQDTTALLDHVHIWSWHLQMARRIVFTDSGFWEYSWAHLVMSMTESCRWVMQCCLRARRPQASNNGLWPGPLRT